MFENYLKKLGRVSFEGAGKRSTSLNKPEGLNAFDRGALILSLKFAPICKDLRVIWISNRKYIPKQPVDKLSCKKVWSTQPFNWCQLNKVKTYNFFFPGCLFEEGR